MHGLTRTGLAAGALLLAACSGAQSQVPSSQESISASPAAAVLTGHFSLGGDYTFSATFSAPAAVTTGPSGSPAPVSSCGMYATSQGAFLLPTISVTSPRPIFLKVQVSTGYHGPGNYAAAEFSSISGTAAVSIPNAEGYAVQVYRSTDASPMSLTVRADGSGSFTFQHWRTDEIRGTQSATIAGHLDGVLSWTCAS